MRVQRFPQLEKLTNVSSGSKIIFATVLMVSLGVYAVIVYPKMNHDYFKQAQEENYRRSSLTREKIAQGMNTWHDPFDRDVGKSKLK